MNLTGGYIKTKKVLLPRSHDKESYEEILEAEDELEELKRFVELDTTPITSEDEWFERSSNAYAVLLFHNRIKLSRYGEFLDQAKELRMIQTPSIGYDGIDVQLCTERGIIVCNVPGVLAESVAQHNLALILHVSKNLGKSDRAMRAGGWLSQGRYGIELYGKTLGIIGLGNIGGRVALKGSLAFGMRILAYDPYVLPDQAQLYGAQLVDLDILLRESDVVSVNCPLNEATYHLLGREQLELLKPRAILVNTARGKVIDEKALAEALDDERFFGAGLDVYEEEPLSHDSPLRRLDNVVLTNHISPFTREAMSETRRSSIRNIHRFIKGERPHWVVNPSAFNIQR